MKADWIEHEADTMADRLANLMKKAYCHGYDEGKQQAWSDEIKRYELDPEKIREAELRGAETGYRLAEILFVKISDSDMADIFPDEWEKRGYNAIAELPYITASEKYKDWLNKHKNFKKGDLIQWHKDGKGYEGIVIGRESGRPVIFIDGHGVCDYVAVDSHELTRLDHPALSKGIKMVSEIISNG